jgi:hypothetical protein
MTSAEGKRDIGATIAIPANGYISPCPLKRDSEILGISNCSKEKKEESKDDAPPTLPHEG